MNEKEKAVLAKNLFKCTDSEIEEAVKKGLVQDNIILLGCNIPTKTYKYVTGTVCDRSDKETLNNTGDKTSPERKPD